MEGTDPNRGIYPAATTGQVWALCPTCFYEHLVLLKPNAITYGAVCQPCLWRIQGWAITLSQLISWKDYEKELNSGDTLNWRVRGTKAKPGDLLWVCWRGRIRGWMMISAVVKTDGFQCTTTGKWWPAGTYIQRKGLFHYVKGPFMKGFRGVRKYPQLLV